MQCKLSWPISRFRDRRGTAILATTAVANLVQWAHYVLMVYHANGVVGMIVSVHVRAHAHALMCWQAKYIHKKALT